MVKQNKEIESMGVQQVCCPNINCKSLRHQVLTYEIKTTKFLLNIICMNCGALQMLVMNSKNQFKIIEEEIKSRENNYLG